MLISQEEYKALTIRTSVHFDPHPNPALRAPGRGEEAQEPGFEGRLEPVVHHAVGIRVPWKSLGETAKAWM